MKRLIQMPDNVLRMFHHGRIFGDAAHHRDDLAFLVAELPQARYRRRGKTRRTLDLAGDNDHRYRIGPGAEYAVEGVDSTGAGGDVQHRRRVGDTGIGFGSHGGGLLVVEEDGRQAGLMGEGVVKEHGATAGDEE